MCKEVKVVLIGPKGSKFTFIYNDIWNGWDSEDLACKKDRCRASRRIEIVILSISH